MSVPAFGSWWNEDPSHAEDYYAVVFNRLQRAKRYSRYNITNAKNTPFPSRMKLSKKIELPKSDEGPYLHEAAQRQEDDAIMQVLSSTADKAEMDPADEGPSKGSEIQMADEAVQRLTNDNAQLGMGNIGYKVMDKIKQRVSDVVSHNRNIEVLQTRIQVLMEEIAQVQPVALSGENNTKNEFHNWYSEATHILQDANAILEDRNSMANKKRMCSSCWDPTPSWETGEILRGIDKILEKRQFLDLPSCLRNKFIRNGDKRKLFLLCCLIHEQAVDVPLEKLKRYGIGFGLFEEDSLSPIDDQMNLWVHEFKSLSLLLEAKPQHVKIHDKNVGISPLSQDDDILPVLVDVGSCWDTRESYENCIAISMMSDSNYKCLNGLELNKLQALLLKDIQSLTLPGNFFRRMPGLKVLEISGTKFLEFPASIQALKNLVTLHLEYCDLKRESISSISKLDELKVLSLRGSRFKALPEEIGKLNNLRVLDLNSCIYRRLLPVDAVMKMVRLKELYLNGGSNTMLNSVDTNKLSQMPLEVLEVSIPRHMSCRRNLKFVNLRRFRILIGGEFGDLEHISCFSRVILMKYYSCREVAESGLTDLLPTTEYLRIEGVTGLSNSITDLYGNVFLNLKNIYIVNCQMKCILDASTDAFPELETLTLENLSNLEIICRWNWKSPSILFPQLRELRLTDLRKLRPYVLPAQLTVQLRVIEVSKCGSLLCIFPTEFDNDTDGADLCLELPYLEILELKYLKRVQSLQYSSKRDRCGLLFTGKIKLPSLKKMHLYGLDQIENMWDLSGSKNCAAGLLQNQPYGVNPWFGNLKSMTVSQRNNINNLFTSTILNSLLQLETLIVEACYQMKEVISGSPDVEDESSPTTIITFPRLKVLRLASLGSLECFYRGRQWLQFPMLKTLHLTGLTEMKAFVLPTTQSVELGGQALFDGEIDFPSLEHLEVSHMYSIKLLERQGETTKFSHLSRLSLRRLSLTALPTIDSKTLRFMNLQDLDCCNVLFSLEPLCIPSMSLIMSQEIEELRLSELDSVEDLVDKWFFSLKKLELHRLRQLRTVPWHRLSRLNCLIIIQLHSWTCMITTTLLVGGAVLPLLESIQITDCSSLEAVISREEKDKDFVEYGVTVFPSLKKIQLSWLPRLESFSMGGYEAHFPSLEKMEIVGCPSLQSFSVGPLRVPRLNSVILNSKVMKADHFYDLNSALAEAFQEDTEAARRKEEEEHQTLRKKRQQPMDLGYLKWSDGANPGDGLLNFMCNSWLHTSLSSVQPVVDAGNKYLAEDFTES